MRVEVKIDEAKMRSLISTIKRSTDFVMAGLSREVEDAANDTERAARANAIARLPRRGGFASEVARSKFSRRRNRIGGGYSTEVIVSSSYDLAGIDQGMIIHPTYGRAPWVQQRVPPGWFGDSVETASDELIKDVDSLVSRSVSLIR